MEALRREVEDEKRRQQAEAEEAKMREQEQARERREKEAEEERERAAVTGDAGSGPLQVAMWGVGGGVLRVTEK